MTIHGSIHMRKACTLLAVLGSCVVLNACASAPPQPAVSWRDAVQVRRALQNGADVEAPDGDGWTRLLSATRRGDAAVVQVLVQFGADMHARNRHGWSALLIASRYGYPEIVSYLIEEGAYVHTKNHADYTPLMLAALGGHTRIIQTLVRAGVRLDVTNDAGKTALFYAARNRNEEMVAYLLAQGLEPEVWASNGEELFATAVTLKARASVHEANGAMSAAQEDLQAAADYFERAELGLIDMANATSNAISDSQTAGVFASLLGVVASAVDMGNLRSGNPTQYSSQMAQMRRDMPDLTPMQVQEAYYRELAQEAAEEAQTCRAMSGDTQ